MIDEADIERSIEILEQKWYDMNDLQIVNGGYVSLSECTVWKVPKDTNLYYIECTIEIGEDTEQGNRSSTESLEIYFRFQEINNKVKITIIDDYDGVDAFMEDDEPIFKPDMTKAEKYKKAYEILMEYFKYIPDEEKPKIHKRLKELEL